MSSVHRRLSLADTLRFPAPLPGHTASLYDLISTAPTPLQLFMGDLTLTSSRRRVTDLAFWLGSALTARASAVPPPGTRAATGCKQRPVATRVSAALHGRRDTDPCVTSRGVTPEH